MLLCVYCVPFTLKISAAPISSSFVNVPAAAIAFNAPLLILNGLLSFVACADLFVSSSVIVPLYNVEPSELVSITKSLPLYAALFTVNKPSPVTCAANCAVKFAPSATFIVSIPSATFVNVNAPFSTVNVANCVFGAVRLSYTNAFFACLLKSRFLFSSTAIMSENAVPNTYSVA